MRTKAWIVIIIDIILVSGVFLLANYWPTKNPVPTPDLANQLPTANQPSEETAPAFDLPSTPETQPPSASDSKSHFAWPIENGAQRVTKKTFGLYVTPQNSPVQPERFQGFHTGTDFETWPEEKNADVAIHAVCDGQILEKKIASGYGGVLVQRCNLPDGSPATVIYGHLKLTSIKKTIHDNLTANEEIGILGKGYSQETDEERKHLHLGIHRGVAINIKGYVPTSQQLADWIDACQRTLCVGSNFQFEPLPLN